MCEAPNCTGERLRKCAKLQTTRGNVRANARSFKLHGGTLAQMREASNYAGERSRKCAKLQTARGNVRANARSFKLHGGTFAQMREASNCAGERSRNARSFKMRQLAKSRFGLSFLCTKMDLWQIRRCCRA